MRNCLVECKRYHSKLCASYVHGDDLFELGLADMVEFSTDVAVVSKGSRYFLNTHIVLYNRLTMIKSLMRLWRVLPMWLHVVVTRITQPKFNAGVSSLIFDEQGRVLLFKHTYRKYEWGIPGGALEYKEQPIEAVVREFYEETGMKIEVIRLLKVASAREFPHLGITYLCKMTGGEFKPSHEVSAMDYFDPNELPMMLFAEKDLIRWAAKEIKQ